MVHFSVFGGFSGRVQAGRNLYLSVFGPAQLRRPAAATRLIEARQGAHRGEGWACVYLSIFGGLTIKAPTLAEEFLALLDALRCGALTLDEWDRSGDRLVDQGGPRTAFFSVFGGLNADVLPGEDEELDDLSLQRHAGFIPEPSLDRLMLAIGHGGAQRLAAVRQAVVAALSATPRAARL